MDAIIEEMEAMQSIYCGVDEFVTHKSTDTDQVFTVTVQCGGDKGENMSISFTLTDKYPNNIPDLSLQSDLYTRKECETLKQDIVTFSESLVGQPMLMDILTWVQENANGYRQKRDQITSTNNSKDYEKGLVTCLLHLDHMRAKVKYTKTIQKWTEELSLTGKLIFYEKLILILIQGLQSDVKDYIQRQRTVNVDVDSKGRSCKERMLSLLSEQELNEEHRLPNFTVVECFSGDELKSIFTSSKLEELYLTDVLPLFKR